MLLLYKNPTLANTITKQEYFIDPCILTDTSELLSLTNSPKRKTLTINNMNTIYIIIDLPVPLTLVELKLVKINEWKGKAISSVVI